MMHNKESIQLKETNTSLVNGMIPTKDDLIISMVPCASVANNDNLLETNILYLALPSMSIW